MFIYVDFGIIITILYFNKNISQILQMAVPDFQYATVIMCNITLDLTSWGDRSSQFPAVANSLLLYARPRKNRLHRNVGHKLNPLH